MMHDSRECSRFEAFVATLIDGGADAPTADREFVERHRQTCDSCSSLETDLRTIRDSAGRLPLLSPNRDLWPAVEARIQAPVIGLGEAPRRGLPRKRTRVLVAAAAALMLATAASTYVVMRALQGGQTPSGASEAVFDAGAAVAESYGTQITTLQSVLNARRSRIDSATASVIEKNLRIIDNAIGQIVEALEREPASVFLLDQYRTALDAKLGLLRTAVNIPGVSN